jgi:hypothetical protein
MPTRGPPKELRDAYVGAINSALLVFNNLTSMPDWLSDVLCVITEGSGDSRRGLFTDADESVVYACSPAMLTAVTNIVTKGDLGARTLYAALAPVLESERKTEPDLWREFNDSAPEILGALCTSLSVGLRRLPTIKSNLPRMATYAKFAMACETAFWPKGTFAAAFENNVQKAVAELLESNVAVMTLRSFLEDRLIIKEPEHPHCVWSGTASQLHTALTEWIRKPESEAAKAHQRAGDERNPALQTLTAARLREAIQNVKDVISSGWPKTPNHLTAILREAGPQLRKVGISITWPTSNRDRRIFIEDVTISEPSSRPSRPSQNEGHHNENNNLSGKMAGRSTDFWEDQIHAGSEDEGDAADGGAPFGAEPGEDLGRSWEDGGKIKEQTGGDDNQLKKQANPTSREDREDREDQLRNSHSPLSENGETGSPPDSNKQKPPKRTISL